ncbi:hypothetical protein RhiirA5_501120 [Rhizophagus irregularis]|uniref:GRF-type domain-containing protein n=1 Tax=Rhizophagus irregularis TaxID=588596 RepID=A0A2I1DZH7_9GLOM|nr:hypothetical protein RhiirA5_501120 [Rhizophagus irregularis]PKY15277.1 hypothetical protein RhiirB3_466614 [Rhizophagus irregularis]CAB5385811.1 unnamed protein product [Rhizophagus irregularis]
MGTISPNFHNLNANSHPPQDFKSFHDLNDNSHSQSYLGFHDLNENPLQQNYSSEMQTPHLRPRSNSAPRVTMPSSTSFSSLSNTSIRQSQQRVEVKNCKCGLEPVLREVKVNTPNKGRWFWSCSKFGGPDHSEKCNYFKWENSLNQNADVTGESSSTARDTQDTYRNDDVVVNDDNNNIIIGDEVNTTPINNNDVIENPSRSHNRASSQAISSTSNGTTTNRSLTNRTTETGHAYTRSPAVFGNWENVPKYSTPQLMDIMQNHLVQQDRNYKKWHINTQLAKKDYEEAKKEVEKLMRELEVVGKENELFKRENEVLKAEKRLMEREISILNEENRDLKRRR